jgi:hypothetical protein
MGTMAAVLKHTKDGFGAVLEPHVAPFGSYLTLRQAPSRLPWDGAVPGNRDGRPTTGILHQILRGEREGAS